MSFPIHSRVSPVLLLEVLATPSLLTHLSPEHWDHLLRIARNEGLLSRIACLTRSEASRESGFPAKACDHLKAAAILGDKHEQVVRWEVDRIGHALHHLDTPIVLLKGAAYVAAQLPLAKGRLVSDVDILVPEGDLAAVEASLLAAGWEHTNYDAYDQYYYREWMHELPPLQHGLRHTLIDVHHTLLPRTSRLKPDPRKLFAAAVPLENSRLCVLAPVDMVLHSATHLFYDGEFDHGLRDLVDLHELLTHFGAREGFWSSLVPRALELDLQLPLYYALRYTSLILGTEVPVEVLAASKAGAPSVFKRAIMDMLVPRVLQPKNPDVSQSADRVAAWLLYLRGHYLRMPLRLLIPHLMRKAMVKKQDVTEEA